MDDWPQRARAGAALISEVARMFHVREAAILAAGRTGAGEALARHVAMYLAHVALGWTYVEVAAVFRRHRTCVTYACARIEDRRDDPAFDAHVARLEQSLTTTLGDGE